MSDYLCVSVTFLDARFHGRGDGNEPEWPPSPLRLFQSLVAANSESIGDDGESDAALCWLERQPPPIIFAPRSDVGEPFRLSVPNNAMDIVGRAWSKGNYFGSGDANPATHHTMKSVRPVRMIEGDTVRYLWPLSGSEPATEDVVEALVHAAGRIFALGWGIDMVVGRGEILTTSQLDGIAGECWKPNDNANLGTFRIPVSGTLAAVKSRYESFLNRIDTLGFTPVDPLTHFDSVSYRRSTDTLARPYVVFELRNDDSFFRYPQRKLIHIAGMVRHLAIELMKSSPPSGVGDDWVEIFIAGHARPGSKEHRQLSYLPLPSIGHAHTDPSVRRVMIVAPLGDDRLLHRLARLLAGQRLKPTRRTQLDQQPTLVRVRRDNVARLYTKPAVSWASVTPVILPGHDDHKPIKTRKLIERAIQQSDIDQPCEFEWSAFSHFPKSLSAHKYDRDKRETGYIRPDHLLTKTAVHLKLRFNDDLKVPGPLVIGAGRHCGLGLLAAIDR